MPRKYKWPTVADRGIKKEAEANIFAMALLMPEEMVAKQMELLGERITYDDGSSDLLFQDRAIETMAEIFQVDIPIMTLRLKQLGYMKTFPV